MTHPTIEKLAWHINWANTRMIQYIESLTTDELCQQPSPVAPPIGWHIWHHARFADMFQANLSDQPEVWVLQNMVDTCGLEVSRLGPTQLGTGIPVEDAVYICQTIGKQRLYDYATTVAEASDDTISTLSVESLGQMQLGWFRIDLSSKPFKELDERRESLLMDDIGWYIGHANRHLGMIEALIGVMFEREGTATV